MNHQHTCQPTDRHLIKMPAMDAAAFRAAVEQHQAMVYRTCLRILRNAADAEDATQATFIVFHNKSAQLSKETVLAGWLYRTAELVCREFIRGARRRRLREEETALMNATTVQDNTHAWTALQPELDNAMRTLPQKYRDVVVLRYLEDKSTSETAMTMGLSESAVTTRLARALEHLRTWFHRRGIVLGAGVLAATLAENATAATVPPTLAMPSLTVAGAAATTAVSAKTSLMADGALAKMGFVAGHISHGWLSIAWIACMISWVRDGCRTPRWVHILAICLLGAGLMSTAALGVTGLLTPTLAVTCLIAPPAAAYLGWLWMFGPEHAKGR